MEEVFITTPQNSPFINFLAKNIDTINGNNFYLKIKYANYFSLENIGHGKEVHIADEEDAIEFLLNGSISNLSDESIKQKHKEIRSKQMANIKRESTSNQNQTLDDEDISTTPENSIPTGTMNGEVDKAFFESLEAYTNYGNYQ